MRFTPTFLEEIKSRIPISDVVGARVAWDKRKSNPGRGDWWACCPFHGEKSPSFHCENRKGRYHCFGCGASGDHFRFLVELEGLSFPEAVERLAAQAGVAMPVDTPQERAREARKASLHEIMEMAAAFFEAQLQEAGGAKARAYLRDRGLAPRTQQEFRIGYAPDSRNALKEHLAARGVGKEEMEACGLVRAGPDIPVSYDWFRDRIMFPIGDSRGRVIAFGGRALRADVPAKYMNSPDTDLFHKSNVLFNLARARPAAHERKQIVACEGYVDVIALHQAGFPNAVAPLGTALTETQLDMLWRIGEEPVLCFDGDKAGIKAAWRAADLALPGLRPGRTVRFAMLPEGKDPDDLVREEGPAAFAALLEQALPLSDLLWARETDGQNFETPERKAELEARLRELVARIADESVRRHYAQDMATRLEAFFPAPARGRRGDGRTGRGRRGEEDRRPATAARGKVAASASLLNSPMVRRNAAKIPLREAALVGAAVHHPAIVAAAFDAFSDLPLTNPAATRVHRAVLDCFAHWEGEDWPGAKQVQSELGKAGLAEIVDSIDAALRHNRVWQALPGASFEDAAEGWRQSHLLHLKAHSLFNELKAAESAFAVDATEENFARLAEIRNEIAREEGMEALIDGFGLSSGKASRSF